MFYGDFYGIIYDLYIFVYFVYVLQRRKGTKNPKNIQYLAKSKSTVYPHKQTRTDVSGHRSGAVFQCASFIQIMLLFVLYLLKKKYIYIYI